MAIRISSEIRPLGDYSTSATGVNAYPTHLDEYGKGGFVAIDTNGNEVFAEINKLIPYLRRKEGMLVYDVHSEDYYRCINVGSSSSDGTWEKQYFSGRYFHGATSPTASDIQLGERWFDTVVGTEYTYLPIAEGSTYFAWVDIDHLGASAKDNYVNTDGDVMTGTLTGTYASFSVGLTTQNGFIGTLTGINGSFTNLTASNGFIGTLTGINGSFTNLTASNGFIGTLTGINGSFTNLTASNGFIGTLTGNRGSFTNLTASNGFIGTLTGTNGSFTNLTASNGFIGTLTGVNGSFTNLTASNGFIGTLTGVNGSFTNLTASNGFIGTLTGVNGSFTNLTAGTSFRFGPTTQALFQNSQINMTGSTSLLEINPATNSNNAWWDLVVGKITGDDGNLRNNFAVASNTNPVIPGEVFSLGNFNVGTLNLSGAFGRENALLRVHGRALKVTGPSEFLSNEYVTKSYSFRGSDSNFIVLPWIDDNNAIQIAFLASAITTQNTWSGPLNGLYYSSDFTILVPNKDQFKYVRGIVCTERKNYALNNSSYLSQIYYSVTNGEDITVKFITPVPYNNTVVDVIIISGTTSG